ncbi:P1 family peptidase [Falsiroseomonas sp. HW251]|uniref:P1 family peptidase n=1 Tax=Falsiroseomonas sp. HW251 TaxID=3390998 RepID=UPI003D311111
MGVLRKRPLQEGRAHVPPFLLALLSSYAWRIAAISDVPGILVGHWTDTRRPTGCTAIVTSEGALAAVDIRGAAPGTRETDRSREPRGSRARCDVVRRQRLQPRRRA